jgi:hypothetical protein
VGFNEIRLQVTDQGTQLVNTESKEYTYKWNTSLWEITNINHEQTLVNPLHFTVPISEPNTLGRETEYQEQLERILSQPDDFSIDAQYWNSVDSTDTASDIPELSSRASTPVIDTCACGIDICYCDRYRPDTPPTPSHIKLWKPSQGPQPIQGIHFQRPEFEN